MRTSYEGDANARCIHCGMTFDMHFVNKTCTRQKVPDETLIHEKPPIPLTSKTKSLQQRAMSFLSTLVNTHQWNYAQAYDLVRDMLDEKWNERPVHETPAPHAMHALTGALSADPDYAWAWHCNLAMPIMDCLKVSHEANEAGAALMQHLFRIDIRQHPYWGPAVKTSLTQCLYRSGCKNPEVCQNAGCCVPGGIGT